MAWLFERTVEAAAWVALVVAWVSLGLSIYWIYLFLGTAFATEFANANFDALRNSTKAAGAFVGFALALGALACIDRFLFDADED
jgi:multisubunit Na+/H+ antiporter MnhB subunit